MKTLIICHSYHHGNTKKVADAMAAVLQAEVVNPRDVNARARWLWPHWVWLGIDSIFTQTDERHSTVGRTRCKNKGDRKQFMAIL